MAMHAQLKSLIQNYAAPLDGQTGEPLLLHGVYSWHSGHGVDEGNLWGDYFYMEALIRFIKTGNYIGRGTKDDRTKY